jgi:hypothetical protein
MGGTCRSDGEGRGVYSVFVEKHEGKRQLGRPRRRWDNIYDISRLSVNIMLPSNLMYFKSYFFLKPTREKIFLNFKT